MNRFIDPKHKVFLGCVYVEMSKRYSFVYIWWFCHVRIRNGYFNPRKPIFFHLFPHFSLFFTIFFFCQVNKIQIGCENSNWSNRMWEAKWMKWKIYLLNATTKEKIWKIVRSCLTLRNCRMNFDENERIKQFVTTCGINRGHTYFSYEKWK